MRNVWSQRNLYLLLARIEDKRHIFFFIQNSLMQELRKMHQCLDSSKYQCTNGKQCCAGLHLAPMVLSEKLNYC